MAITVDSSFNLAFFSRHGHQRPGAPGRDRWLQERTWKKTVAQCIRSVGSIPAYYTLGVYDTGVQGCIWYRIIRVGKPSMPMNQWWLMNRSKISKAEWTGNHGLYHHFFLWGSLVWFREPRWKFYHGGTVVMMTTTRRARGWRWRWRLGDCYFDDADSDNDSGFIWVYKIL